MLSIIIPFQYDSVNRLENLLLILNYIKQNIKFTQVIVSEFDVVPRVFNLLPDFCEYVFGSSKVWSRSKAINLGSHLVSERILLALDADIVLDPVSISVGVDSILQNKFDLLLPYKEVYHFPRDLILKKLSLGIDVKEFCDNNVAVGVYGGNGVFLTRSDLFKHLRGMNENFFGWGLEDDELLARYQKLGYSCVRSNSPAIHINHARTSNCCIVEELIIGSLREKHKVFSLSKDNLLDYFGIKEKVGGYTSCDKQELSSSILSAVENEYIRLKTSPKENYVV